MVSSDYGKGGTWTGAIEQLEKLKLVPVHVRADGDVGKGLDELRKRGAMSWPNPQTAEDLESILEPPRLTEYGWPEQRTLSSAIRDDPGAFGSDREAEELGPTTTPDPHVAAHSAPADELFAKVKDLLDRMDGPQTDARVAGELQGHEETG